jgi:hypothetical protein
VPATLALRLLKRGSTTTEDRMRSLALSILLLPSIARAQMAPQIPPAALPVAAPAPSAEPSECVTTTTVRCTGAAAPYAVQAAQPETVVVPPLPPVAPPPPAAPPPQVIVLDPHKLGGDGWKLVQSPDGCLWRERKRSTASPGMWAGGLGLFVASYLAGAIGGMAGEGNPAGFWPVLGPIFEATFTDDSGKRTLYAIDGVAQASGFVLFLVGLAAGPEKLERQPITIGPTTFHGGGNGVALSARF